MKTTEPPPQTTPTNATAAPVNPAPKPAEAADPSARPLAIGAHHRANFEQAHAHLQKTYGKSPPPDDLMRLWLACATPWDITREFEESVLNIAGSDLVPDDNGHYAQSLLNL